MKNRHIIMFFAAMLLLFVFFMLMFKWLRNNSPTEEFGASNTRQPAISRTH